ncbi:hypothetical protein [Accumulibacter sp.]|uniref:hypothetical protein n=1 Tax=Accumulibacter sp. TaxID=2053492 RepID=UPI0025FDBAC9|nr:hypothetical protein [Accumulibacter sp.]MCM8611383.1 hypothetical protein [Accumulibacter sp.]MCM8634970.1 hypothetical protein [Accumulibacter sp.]MCM8639758.1 hypothetical protein [Accumulibacter sp.]
MRIVRQCVAPVSSRRRAGDRRAEQHLLDEHAVDPVGGGREGCIEAQQEFRRREQPGDEAVLFGSGGTRQPWRPFAAPGSRLEQVARNPRMPDGAAEGQRGQRRGVVAAARQPFADDPPVVCLAQRAARKGRAVGAQHGVRRVAQRFDMRLAGWCRQDPDERQRQQKAAAEPPESAIGLITSSMSPGSPAVAAARRRYVAAVADGTFPNPHAPPSSAESAPPARHRP